VSAVDSVSKSRRLLVTVHSFSGKPPAEKTRKRNKRQLALFNHLEWNPRPDGTVRASAPLDSDAESETAKSILHSARGESITRLQGKSTESPTAWHREHNAYKEKHKEMKFMKSTNFLVLTTLCLLATLIVPNVRADEWNKKTTLTFNEPVQVPGVALPAGTYVFKLADTVSDRNIVQIWNADETKLITTILAIADYRTQTADKTIISFDERPTGQPEALKAWFYPGDNFGIAFVYPKQKAVELAQVNRQPVLSTREEVTDVASMKSAPVEPVAPPPEAAAPPPTSTTQVEVAEVEAVELPKTASPMPAIAFGGVLLLAGAFGVRRFSLARR